MKAIIEGVKKAFKKKPKRSKVLFIIDPGHGGLHPETQQYVTPGKRMVNDGVEYYEGVNNRDNAWRLIKALEANGLEAVNLCPSFIDVKIGERCERANTLAGNRKALLISLHTNAAGNGREWHSARGIDTFIHPNASANSYKFGELVQEKLINNLGHLTKNRGLKERNFGILRGSNMPAVLIELGFHTNEIEVKRMLTDEWKDLQTATIVEACKIYESWQ